jgi:hypothetical protein
MVRQTTFVQNKARGQRIQRARIAHAKTRSDCDSPFYPESVHIPDPRPRDL